MAADEVDAVVVGVGAAGGVLIRKLTEAGWHVVGLDAGPHWDPQKDFLSDERSMSKLFWRDRRVSTGDDPLELAGNVTGKGVGGSTTHYSMYALRLHQSDFEIATRDGVKLSRDEVDGFGLPILVVSFSYADNPRAPASSGRRGRGCAGRGPGRSRRPGLLST